MRAGEAPTAPATLGMAARQGACGTAEVARRRRPGRVGGSLCERQSAPQSAAAGLAVSESSLSEDTNNGV